MNRDIRLMIHEFLYIVYYTKLLITIFFFNTQFFKTKNGSDILQRVSCCYFLYNKSALAMSAIAQIRHRMNDTFKLIEMVAIKQSMAFLYCD